jgi:polyhydroxybutyrate depolymerase
VSVGRRGTFACIVGSLKRLVKGYARRHWPAGSNARRDHERWWWGATILLAAITLAALLLAMASSARGVASVTAKQAAVAATTGCGARGDGGSITTTVAGYRRTVVVHLPSGYTGSSKLPLVLNMHGSGSTASQQELLTGMDGTANADKFIVAYPQGLIADGTGYVWNIPGEPLVGGKAVPAHAANDVEFLTKLVGVLEQRYCINSARVYATGFSGGARIASQLACDSSTVFAAVAAVSGVRRPTPCLTSRPVAILAFHGTADPVDPYNGHGQAYWTYSVPQAAASWATQDGCSTTAATSTPEHGVTLTDYTHCKAGSAVELYSIAGEGHEWPGGPPLGRVLTSILGPQTTAINANTVMWAFFEAHPLP